MLGNRVTVRLGTGVMFLGPAALLYLLFVVVPVLQTVGISATNWGAVRRPLSFSLAGYSRLIGDRIFWVALRNNLFWIVASIVNPMLVALVLATLLNSIVVARKLYLTVFFIPVVLTLVIVGLVWGLMYSPIVGPINKLLAAIGLGRLAVGWLGDPYWAVPAIIIAGNWTYFGFCTVVFLAGMQAINPNLLEAATLDGAGPVRRFVSIIIPGIRNQINLLVVYSIIGSFKVFDIVYVMTKGGPNHSTEVIATYMYWQAFENGEISYGAALAVVLGVVVAVLSLTFLRASEASE